MPRPNQAPAPAHVAAARPATGPLRRGIAYCLAAIFLLALAQAGTRAAVKQLRSSIESYRSHNRLIPVGVERGAAYVRSQMPPDSPLLLVVSEPDAWADGLWQRALYPNPIFLVYKEDLGTPEDHELRRKYGIRFAVSIGNPPLNPAFRWQRPLPDWTGAGQVAFGEVER